MLFLGLLALLALLPSPAQASGASAPTVASTSVELRGYTNTLNISRKAVRLGDAWRSDRGKLRPRRDPDRNYTPMPKRSIRYLLKESWQAFGFRGRALDRRVAKNYQQIGRESGGRPYIKQGYIGDVNDNNPAGGLFQLIPETFKHWKVNGFNDRFNPLDNILAVVNAQVNGPMKTLDGSSGFATPWSKNPYAKGKKYRITR
jgi:hypothetical protein